MALADITLTDSQATPVNHVFAYETTDTKTGQVIRKNLAAALDAPEHLAIGQKQIKARGVPVTSTLWKLAVGRLDADSVTTRYIDVKIVIDVDPKIYTDALMEDIVTMVRTDFTETNVKNYVKGSKG